LCDTHKISILMIDTNIWRYQCCQQIWRRHAQSFSRSWFPIRPLLHYSLDEFLKIMHVKCILGWKCGYQHHVDIMWISIATAAAAELHKTQYSSSFLTAPVEKVAAAVCWWWSHIAHARMTVFCQRSFIHLNYRAMHFSAKRGIAIACRLSVRLSVCPSVRLWRWWIVIT